MGEEGGTLEAALLGRAFGGGDDFVLGSHGGVIVADGGRGKRVIAVHRLYTGCTPGTRRGGG
ncbi:MAG: hypothetical protein Gyms2KO_13810 [Gymnodinialimonas sp.]